jgi:isoleucyl-tRNA synthetase
MQGYRVVRKAGWDTHGLPVELEVEKMLGINGKKDIEKYGIEPFNNKCKQSVWKYKGEWEKMSERVGFWADMDNPYITYDDKYIESVWWALKTIADKGLLYKGFKIVPYCPRCGTALSSHEVAQGYKDVQETSVFVRFKIKGEENKYFLAWTTTPWTLPSNVALCMNADKDYAEIESDGVHYILADALVSALFENYTLISKKKGKEYEYTQYEPLYDFTAKACGDKKASPDWYAVDTSLAVENMVLTAVSEGLGTCCVGSFIEKDVKAALKIPENFEVLVMLTVGYAGEKLDLTSKMLNLIRSRKVISEVCSEEEFGKNFIPKKIIEP